MAGFFFLAHLRLLCSQDLVFSWEGNPGYHCRPSIYTQGCSELQAAGRRISLPENTPWVLEVTSLDQQLTSSVNLYQTCITSSACFEAEQRTHPPQTLKFAWNSQTHIVVWPSEDNQQMLQSIQQAQSLSYVLFWIWRINE